MALILKEGKTFADPFNGEITTAYLNIKDFGFNDNSKECRFTVEIYSSQEARVAHKQPIFQKNYVVSGDDFETWFGINVLSQEGINMRAQAYEYIKQLTHKEIVDSEEVDVRDYKDWEDLV